MKSRFHVDIRVSEFKPFGEGNLLLIGEGHRLFKLCEPTEENLGTVLGYDCVLTTIGDSAFGILCKPDLQRSIDFPTIIEILKTSVISYVSKNEAFSINFQVTRHGRAVYTSSKVDG